MLGETDVAESRRQLLLFTATTALGRYNVYVDVIVCICICAVPWASLKKRTWRGINFFSIKNDFHCVMFSFSEPKMRMWAGGSRSPVRARSLRTIALHTSYIVHVCTYIAVYVHTIIYCVYRYASQRAALLMSLLWGLSFNSSPDRGGRVRWQEPSAETRTPPLPPSLLLEFCSVRGVYIIIHYTYTLMCMRTSLFIIYCAL